MRLTSGQLERMATFVLALEDLTRQTGVQIAVHTGTQLSIDGKAQQIEICNRSTGDEDDPSISYVVQECA